MIKKVKRYKATLLNYVGRSAVKSHNDKAQNGVLVIKTDSKRMNDPKDKIATMYKNNLYGNMRNKQGKFVKSKSHAKLCRMIHNELTPKQKVKVAKPKLSF